MELDARRGTRPEDDQPAAVPSAPGLVASALVLTVIATPVSLVPALRALAILPREALGEP